MTQPTFYELNAVIALAEHHNFREAAKSLNLSPSALSHSVGGLERRIGVRLFHRTTRSVSLSEAGQSFLNKIRPALNEISAAVESINDFKEKPSGLIRINTSEVSGRLVLMPLVTAFMKRFSEISFEVVSEGRLVDIVKDGFDFGLRLKESVPQDMVAIPCGPKEVRMVVVGSPAYFKKNGKPRSPTDLSKHEAIRLRFSSGNVYRWEFEKHGKEVRVDVRGRLTLDNESMIIEAATKGLGLAFVSEWQIETHLASGKLIPVLTDWTPYFPGLSLFYSSHRNLPAATRAFIDFVRASK